MLWRELLSTGNKDSTQPQHDRDTGNPFGNLVVSPSKAVDLRMKNYEQLRIIQQLFEDGILDEKEYTEQKGNILEFLRKLK